MQLYQTLTKKSPNTFSFLFQCLLLKEIHYKLHEYIHIQEMDWPTVGEQSLEALPSVICLDLSTSARFASGGGAARGGGVQILTDVVL